MKRRVLSYQDFFLLSCKVRQPLLSPLPFSYPSCPSSSQLDVIWPVNGTLLYSFLSGHVSRCREQQHLWSLQMAASSQWTWGRKLHPANTQTLCAQLSFGSLGHHWRSKACPLFPSLFFLFERRLLAVGPRGAWPWPSRRDHERPAGLWTYYPCVPGVNSLVAAGVNRQEVVLHWATWLTQTGSLWHHDPTVTVAHWRNQTGWNLDFWNVCMHNGGKYFSNPPTQKKKKPSAPFKMQTIKTHLPTVNVNLYKSFKQQHEVKHAGITVNTIDLRWDTIKYYLLWSWEIHDSKSNQTYHQSMFEEDSFIILVATCYRQYLHAQIPHLVNA